MLREISKFGYNKQEFDKKSLTVKVRPNTTDDKVIDEVLTKNSYQKKKIGFLLEDGEKWLDLGANIGTFSLLVLCKKNTSVICVEPEEENLDLLTENLSLNFPDNRSVIIEKAVSTKEGNEKFYLCNGEYNKYRHTLIPIRNRSSIDVETTTMKDIFHHHPDITCVKMDIKGTEIVLLEDPTAYEKEGWITCINKLVFEYSFDRDPSIPRFVAILNRLRKVFPTVYTTKVKEDELVYKYYPACTMVYCVR